MGASTRVKLERFQVAFFTPPGTGVYAAFVDENVNGMKPGDFALDFVLVGTHEFIQLADGDAIGVKAHEIEDRFDGAVLLWKFSTIRHDFTFWLPGFK